MAKKAGKDSVIKVGGTAICVESFEITPEADFIDTTNTCSNGYQDGIAGVKRYDGSAQGTWDDSAPITGSPPNINIGETIALALYTETGGQSWIGNGIVTSTPVTFEVAGKVSYTFNWKSTGAWAVT